MIVAFARSRPGRTVLSIARLSTSCMDGSASGVLMSPSPAKDDTHRDTRRRFEQWARNPHCQANVISAVHNIPMAVVVKAGGGKPSMGQSPFAIQRGQSFEKSLFRNGGRMHFR